MSNDGDPDNVAKFPVRRKPVAPMQVRDFEAQTLVTIEALAAGLETVGRAVTAQSAQVNHLASVVMRLQKANALLVAALRGAAPAELNKLLAEIKVRDVES